MNYINTEIKEITVEIEDKEYAVAEKTVEVADQLITAQKKFAGEPQYKLWMAELEILIGKPAVKELFTSGKRENIDRIQRIHSGVLRAFEYNSDEIQDEQLSRQREQIASLTELFRQITAFSKADGTKAKPVVHRP